MKNNINIYEMSATELRELAKQKKMRGAWKATKAEMIAYLEALGYGEPEETEEIEEIKEEVEESEHKEVKRPSLKINEITFEGKTQSLRAWAEELEMPWPTLYDRINRNGWAIEEALTIPLGGRRQRRA